MTNTLILGGTGFVGRSLCSRLASAPGMRLTVPSRHPAAAKHLQVVPNLRVVSADVHDPAQLARLVEGHDVVVNLVAILHGSAAAFERAHVALPRSLVTACTAAGVRRLVHVSALGVDSAVPSRYLASKKAGEEIVRGSRLAWTVLRPSVIFGAHDRFLNLFAKLAAVVPVFPLASANARFQPVWVEDVAAAIAHCIDRPETIGQVVECTGPQVFTLGELVRLAAQWSGHPRPVLPLPAPLGRLQAMVMEMMPGEPLMSRDNLQSMRTPNIASGQLPSLADLGIRAEALENVAPRYLARA